MGISAAGMLSGLDVDGLVTSLMSVERQPLEALATKQSSFNAKLSAFGTLKSAVSTFQTAVKNVSGTSMAALTATSSKSDVVGVSTTSGSGASAGSYSIEVSKLALADKRVSESVAPASKFSGAGSLSISIGDKAMATPLELTDTTLAGLSDAINKANAGVTATILNDGTGDRLVITGNETGTANEINITATGSLAAFDTSNAGMLHPQKAQNAEMTIDGIFVSKASNTVIDAIKGVTLNLSQTNSGNPAKLTLTKDTAGITSNINAFIDAYNALATSVSKQTAYNATSKTSAVLNGDAGARSIMTSLRAELGKAVSAGGEFKMLSDIGISFQRDGTLKLEKPEKLSAALASNADAVGSLFSATDGVGTRLTAVTTDMLSSKGVFQTRTDGLNASIKTNQASQDRMSLLLEQTDKRYRAQFTALDTLMVTMQNTTTYLTQQLAALAANNNSK